MTMGAVAKLFLLLQAAYVGSRSLDTGVPEFHDESNYASSLVPKYKNASP